MSDFGFDPSIIMAARYAPEPTPNETMQTLAQLAQSRAQTQQTIQGTQAAAYHFQREQEQASTLAGIARQNPNMFPSRGAQTLAEHGFAKEAFDFQNHQIELGHQIYQVHANLTASQLAAANTPQAARKVLTRLRSDPVMMQRNPDMPADDAPDEDVMNWAKTFPASMMSPEERAKAIEIKDNPATGQMFMVDKATRSVNPVGGVGVAAAGLSGPALEIAAKNYERTGGEMPEIGRDPSSLAHKSILARHAELFPNSNLSANKATYKADAASLEHLQPQADQINGFIRTFDKNMKQLEGSAAKLQSSNRPGLNKGLRWYQQNVSGDPALSAFKQALSTVTSEAGKINSGSTGAGGVPISVMQEMEENLPANATPAQIVEALKVLRKDSENRRDSMREQISAIKHRLGGDQKPGSRVAAPDHDAAATWLRSSGSKSDPNYARALAAYKHAHGGAEP